MSVGIGAACREGSRTPQTTVVKGTPATTTTAAVITSTETKLTVDAPPPYSQPPVPYPASGYPLQGYPAIRYSQENLADYPRHYPGAYPPGGYLPQPPGVYPSAPYPPQ